MGEAREANGRIKGLWPFRVVGRYRLSVERVDGTPLPGRLRADDTRQLARFLGEAVLAGEEKRVVGAAFIDRNLAVIGYTYGEERLARGVGADPLGLFVMARHMAATGIVLFQRLRRPGPPVPTGEDLRVTGDLLGAGELLGMRLADHLLVGSTGEALSLRSYRQGDWKWPASEPDPVRWPDHRPWKGRTRRVKFRHPERPKERWAGTGTPPRWFQEEVAAGRAVEELLALPDEVVTPELLAGLERQLTAGLAGVEPGPATDDEEALRGRLAEIARERLSRRRPSRKRG